MATESSCALGLVSETLSAWRDEALDATTMRTIATHARTCQRCQRRLSQFDMIGQALQRQHTPDLHDRVWHGMQAAKEPRQHAGRGRQVSRLGGVGAAVALLVAVAVVFVALHANHTTHPSPMATATTAPTTTTVPASHFVAAAQAWGNFPKATVLDNNANVYLTDVLADGSGYVGLYGTGQNSPSAFAQERVPGGNVQILYRPSRDENSTVLSDGRYVAFDGEYVFTGGAGGLPHQSVGYIDTQTNKVTTLIADHQGAIDDSPVHAVDHGYFVWAPLTAQGEDLDVTNMANNTTTRIAAISVDKTIPEQNGGLGTALNMRLSWPYVFYSDAGHQQHLYNITDGKDIILSQIHQSDFDFNAFALDGTTVFWVHPSRADANVFELNALDRSDLAGALPQVLATFPRPYKSGPFANIDLVRNMSANSRLVVWNDTNGSYAWDRAQGRLVQIYSTAVQQTSTSTPSTSEYEYTDILLHGNGLMYMSGSADGPPAATTVAYTFIDTAKLPTTGS